MHSREARARPQTSVYGRTKGYVTGTAGLETSRWVYQSAGMLRGGFWMSGRMVVVQEYDSRLQVIYHNIPVHQLILCATSMTGTYEDTRKHPSEHVTPLS